MSRTELLAPVDLPSLAAALGRATPRSRLIAGGTDLMLQLRADVECPDLLIDLSGLRGLSFVRREPGLIRVGAMTTFAELCANSALAAEAGCLTCAAAQVGSQQIRNVATIGGNVANASACADMLPSLLALDTQVGVLNGAGTVAWRPLRDLLAPAGRTTLKSDEAIVEFSFAPLSRCQRSAFSKIGSRSSVTVAKLSGAIVVTLDETHQTITRATIALGSIAPAAFVDHSVAAILCGRLLNSGDTATLFATACASAVNRSIPTRSTLPYKHHAVLGLADDLWSAIGFGGASAHFDPILRPLE